MNGLGEQFFSRAAFSQEKDGCLPPRDHAGLLAYHGKSGGIPQNPVKGEGRLRTRKLDGQTAHTTCFRKAQYQTSIASLPITGHHAGEFFSVVQGQIQFAIDDGDSAVEHAFQTGIGAKNIQKVFAPVLFGKAQHGAGLVINGFNGKRGGKDNGPGVHEVGHGLLLLEQRSEPELPGNGKGHGLDHAQGVRVIECVGLGDKEHAAQVALAVENRRGCAGPFAAAIRKMFFAEDFHGFPQGDAGADGVGSLGIFSGDMIFPSKGEEFVSARAFLAGTQGNAPFIRKCDGTFAEQQGGKQGIVDKRRGDFNKSGIFGAGCRKFVGCGGERLIGDGINTIRAAAFP